MATKQEITETKRDLLRLYATGRIDLETYNAWTLQASSGKTEYFEQA